jgi:hypothetical protein
MRRDGGFSGEGECEEEEGEEEEGKLWSPQADVSGFSMLLFEIVTGSAFPSPSPSPSALPSAASAGEDVILPSDVPEFVSDIIERGLRPMPGEELSFIDIIEILEENDFGIVAGVDSAEVTAFISGIESSEQSGKSE